MTNTLFKQTYTIVDVETTGLSHSSDRVIEIGAIKIINGGIKETFSKLVKTVDSVPSIITEITGITNQELLGKGIAAEDGFKSFREFMGDQIFVAHNVSFDLNFLNSEFSRYQLPLIKSPRIDTVKVARAVLPELYNHKLTTIKNHLGLEIPSHRALEDTKVVWEFLKKYAPDCSRFIDD
jgi:DNA polymerase III epsilon subunit family exonuclease